MKRSIFGIFLFLFFSMNGYSQCTVTPVISFNQVSENSFNLESTQSTYTGQATPYAWQWTVNNDSSMSWSQDQNSIQMLFVEGYNKVCLTIMAQNLTGDTCTGENCNIFFGTGERLYGTILVENDISDPLTKHFTLQHKGGALNSNVTNSFNYGDGNTDTWQGFPLTHTYAAAGEYLTYLHVADTEGNYDDVERKVYVDNGNSNLYYFPFSPINNMLCNSFTANIQTIPPFTFGISEVPPVLGGSLGQPVVGTGISDGVNFSHSMSVPGQYIFRAFMTDNLTDILVTYYSYFVDECGLTPDTVRGYVWSDIDGDGLWDSTETPIVNHEIMISGYGTFTDSTGYYEMLSPNDFYRLKIVLSTQQTVTFPSFPYYYINEISTPQPPPGTLYNFGISNLNSSISGEIYFDFNNNGVQDGGEIGVDQGSVRAFNPITGITYTTGINTFSNYDIDVPPGTYHLRVSYSGVDSMSINPDSIIVTVNGGTSNNNDFGIYSPVNGGNGRSKLHTQRARPGFPLSLNISLLNTGFDTIGGNMVVNYDPILEFVSVSSGVTADTVNHTLSWNNITIPIASSLTKIAEFVVPVGTALGTNLAFTSLFSSILPYTDYNTSDNFTAINITVTGSFDPNDKSVNPAGVGSAGNVLHQDRLRYRINFQNTGTDTAFTVIVQDVIDENLDMNTFLMEGASHSYITIITDNTITWKFFNILLPDSNINEPMSHGYIEYSITPVQNLPDGTVIENTADIYFDFNAAIVTNTTTNTLQTIITDSYFIGQNNDIRLFPNPFTGWLSIYPDFAKNENIKIVLLDITGKKIAEIFDGFYSEGERKEFNGTSLSEGVYLMEFKTLDKRITRKIVR